MKHCRPDNQKNTPYVSSYGSSDNRNTRSRSSNAGRRYRDEQPSNVSRQPERSAARAQRTVRTQNTAIPQNVSRQQYAGRYQNSVNSQYTDISRYLARQQTYARAQSTAKTKQKKKAGPVAITLRIFFIALLLFAGFMAVKTILTYYSEDKAFDQLAAMVDDSGDSAEVLSKYKQLYDMNNDFYGWLKIDDTVINYPVMYTPYDPEKYLHTDFYGEYSESGVLFIDGECVPDGHHYIIYGHHMFNGSMFGNLPKYEREEYYEDHKLIKFDTMTEQGTYEVFAALYSKDYDKSETGVFKYYNYKTLNTEIIFNEYIYNAKQESIYDTGITPQFGDEIITLSTCNYHTEDGRFVVMARKIKNNSYNSGLQ